jgi:hypothetical protein
MTHENDFAGPQRVIDWSTCLYYGTDIAKKLINIDRIRPNRGAQSLLRCKAALTILISADVSSLAQTQEDPSAHD